MTINNWNDINPIWVVMIIIGISAVIFLLKRPIREAFDKDTNFKDNRRLLKIVSVVSVLFIPISAILVPFSFNKSLLNIFIDFITLNITTQVIILLSISILPTASQFILLRFLKIKYKKETVKDYSNMKHQLFCNLFGCLCSLFLILLYNYYLETINPPDKGYISFCFSFVCFASFILASLTVYQDKWKDRKFKSKFYEEKFIEIKDIVESFFNFFHLLLTFIITIGLSPHLFVMIWNNAGSFFEIFNCSFSEINNYSLFIPLLIVIIVFGIFMFYSSSCKLAYKCNVNCNFNLHIFIMFTIVFMVVGVLLFYWTQLFLIYITIIILFVLLLLCRAYYNFIDEKKERESKKNNDKNKDNGFKHSASNKNTLVLIILCCIIVAVIWICIDSNTISDIEYISSHLGDYLNSIRDKFLPT